MKTVDCSVKRRGDAWWQRGRGCFGAGGVRARTPALYRVAAVLEKYRQKTSIFTVDSLFICF